MSRDPVVLDINYKEIRGLTYRSSLTGKYFQNPRKASFESPNEKERSYEIQRFIENNYSDTSGVYLNIPYESQFIRDIWLPFRDRKKIKEILPFELESQLPYEPGEYVFDYYSYPDEENDRTRIFIIGTARNNVQPYLEIFSRMKIPVLGIYSPMDAIYQLSRFIQRKDYAFIHISPITTMLIMVSNNEWKYARVLPLGLDVLIHNIAQEWRTSFEESESVFFNLPPSKENLQDDFFRKHFAITKKKAGQLDGVLSDFSQKMAGELTISIQKSMPAFYDDAQNFPIYISSDYSNAEIIETLISSEIKFPVYSFPYEKTPVALLNKEYTLGVAGAFSQTDNGLKFLDRIFKKIAGSKRSVAVIPVAIGIGLSLLLQIVSFMINYNVKRSDIARLEKAHKAIYQKYFGTKKPNPGLSYMANAKKLMKKTEESTRLYRIFFRMPTLMEILNELNEKTSPFGGNITIDNLNYQISSKMVFINGTIESFSMLNDLKKSLLESKLFENLEADSGKRPGKYGKDEVKFSIKIHIKEKEENAT